MEYQQLKYTIKDIIPDKNILTFKNSYYKIKYEIKWTLNGLDEIIVVRKYNNEKDLQYKWLFSEADTPTRIEEILQDFLSIIQLDRLEGKLEDDDQYGIL